MDCFIANWVLPEILDHFPWDTSTIIHFLFGLLICHEPVICRIIFTKLKDFILVNLGEKYENRLTKVQTFTVFEMPN